MKTLIAPLALLSLSACATTPRTFEDKIATRYMSRPVERMTSDFGPPKMTTKIDGGSKSYEWNLAEGRVPGSPDTCRVLVTASASDIVQTLSVDRTASAHPHYCEEFVALR